MSKQFVLTLLLSIGVQDEAISGNRHSQIVFPFPQKRDFRQSYNPANNTLVIEIANTKPFELNALDHYDEQMIRRVLVKDMGAAGSEVHLTLRDKSVTATVGAYDEPFRIVIDVFDRHYRTKYNPVNGLPLAHTDHLQNRPDTTANFSSPTLGTLMTNEPAAPPADLPSNARRQLMQPTPQILHSPDDLRSKLETIEPGKGKYWQQYPIYMYRVQSAAYHDDNAKAVYFRQHADKAFTSAEAMADYAGNLYDFGHENRALIAYQQVLYKDPGLFDKQPLHLWKFAESHFGQGNLTLADGYYQAMIIKHPNHDLAYFARIRRLDTEAIRATQTGDFQSLGKLIKSLEGLQLPQSAEIRAQATIRKAYWQGISESADVSALNNDSFIPKVQGPIESEMRTLLPAVENQKTAFLLSTLLLNTHLSPQEPWSTETGRLASSFLQRFKGPAVEPYRSILAQKTTARVIASIKDHASKNKHTSVIKIFEQLPEDLKSVRENPHTAWQVAQAYSALGMIEKSVPFYNQAATNLPNGVERFTANFWLALTAGKTRQSLLRAQNNPQRIAYFGQLSRNADTTMSNVWSQLKPEEHNRIYITLRKPLAESINTNVLLRTPPAVLLSAFTQALSTKVDASTSNRTDIANNYSPSAATVRLLSALAARFQDLQQVSNRRKTLKLLRFVKPSALADDAKAKALWAEELVTLAEDYRRDNLYLEAGRTYAFTGANATNFDNRAESLYKGGLLLYRSGRRNEATTAFQQCSEDGENRYYANLCTERLDRLNNQ